MHYTCITVILTLLNKERELESQNVYTINVWGCAEILPNWPVKELNGMNLVTFFQVTRKLEKTYKVDPNFWKKTKLAGNYFLFNSV